MKNFPKKRAASLLLLGFLTACGTTSIKHESHNDDPRPEADTITGTFNQKAVGKIYDISCAAREERREDNIREPQRKTPDYFQKDESKVALYSDHLVEKDREKAREMIRGLPPHVLDLVYAEGAVFLFTARGLGEVSDYYAEYKDGDGRRPYNSSFVGMYTATDKRIYLTFYTAEVKESDNGPEVVAYRPLYGSKSRVFYHEVGHFMDDALGEIGSPWVEFNGVKYSARAEYKKRFEQDFEELVSAGHAEYKLNRISYFLPKRLNGKAYYGDHRSMNTVRSEVFAELWAEVQGHGVYDLKRYYPRTYELVKEMDEQLRALYQKKGHNCGFDEEQIHFDHGLY